MIPWSIGALALLFGIVATVSAATVWRILIGAVTRPLVWPAIWLLVSSGAMIGLPLLRPWGRTLAVAGLWLMVLVSVSVAAALIAGGRPLGALGAGCGAAVPLAAIRYLGRPTIKAYFAGSDQIP